MTEYKVLKHPELQIHDGDKVIKNYRYAINMEENKIKVYEEVENKLYESAGNHKSVSALLDFISQPCIITRPYKVEIYKTISEVEDEN
jgi:rubrerythrin